MESGKLPICGLTFLAFTIVAGYVGWRLLQPWVDYLEFRDEVRETVRLARFLDERRFQRKILEAVGSSGVWIEDPEDNVQVVYRPGYGQVTARWSHYVFFPFDLEYIFDFEVDEHTPES